MKITSLRGTILVIGATITALAFGQTQGGGGGGGNNGANDGWVNFLVKAAAPYDFEENYTLYGSAGSTQHGRVSGFASCTQTEGAEYWQSSAPWTTGFSSIWDTYPLYEYSGTIPTGATSVVVTVTGDTALNSDGTSSWEGWEYMNHGEETLKQVRKIQWKVYDLPSVPID